MLNKVKASGWLRKTNFIDRERVADDRRTCDVEDPATGKSIGIDFVVRCR